MEYDHDEIVKKLALLVETDKRYALVKYFTPANDTKTDLIGSFYPDITTLRKEGKTKLMIEVETPYSFEDSDEIPRLENLSAFCAANSWEFYIACPDEITKTLTEQKISGRNIRPKGIWLVSNIPFQTDSNLIIEGVF